MDPSLASEFPVDNPLLASGSTWVCATPRGRALPTRRNLVLIAPNLLIPEGAVPPPSSLPVASAAPPEPVVAELPPASPGSTTASGPFEAFVQALSQSLLAAGQTRAAALLPGLLQNGRLREGELSEEALDSLRRRGVLEAGGLEVTAGFRSRAEAWRSVLSGASDDLSACGDSTLDGWSAELLCALAGAPKARAGDYRRELRKRGVAAFGLLAA